MRGIAAVAVFLAGLAVPAAGDALTIYQVQHTADPAGASDYAGQVIDCAGGVVTHMFGGSKPKLTLQDPGFPDGWGGIQVKDWTVGLDLFGSVSVGDWVTLTNVEVEEHRSMTLLHFKSGTGAGFSATAGHEPPPPLVVDLDEIPAPVEGPPEEWYVADHRAEKYESMWLTVEDVTVTATHLGKARDNYNLHGPEGDCWGADYMNADRGDLYHPWVVLGAHFQSVSGILEHYEKDEFDYYQLVTTCTEDFVPAPGVMVLLLCGAGAVLSRTRRP